MYDWKAKITRLLELPGLTDEQKGVLDGHLAWVELDTALQELRPTDVRFDEQLIRLDLERLIEARGWRWTIQSMEVGFDAYVVMANDELEYAHGCATPAQALCDALLSAFEEAQQ